MKKLKIFICCFAMCLCAGLFPTNLFAEKTQAKNVRISKPAVVEWDMTNKIIFANLNSLLIIADGEGTTVYLDLPEGASLKDTEYQTGNGVLDENDLSLSELYALDQDLAVNGAGVPANGSDLSEWSIMFGGNDLDAELFSDKTMRVTMAGGHINNMYNGSTSTAAENDSDLNVKILVYVNSGKINEIHTDMGLMGQYGAMADGSDNITFNLKGGTISKITRGTKSKWSYGSTINLSGSVKITEGFDMSKYVRGTSIKLTSELDASASIAFNLANVYERGNELFVADSTLLETLDLERIVVKNTPTDSGDWQLYKANGAVRFGYTSTISSIQILGEFKVGETLTVSHAPASATISSVTWFRVDKVTGQNVYLTPNQDGSYTLTANDGGDYIFVKVTDKNDSTNVLELKATSPVQRVETPKIVTKNGNKYVYANGNDLLIRKDGNGSTIYIDLGTISVYDEGVDMSLYEAGVEKAFKDGIDLSQVSVMAGSSGDDTTGNVSITILSGHVKEIVADSNNTKKIDGNVEFNLFGGVVDFANTNSQKVSGDVYVNLKGNIKTKVYTTQSKLGPKSIKVVNYLTCKNGSITMLTDKNLINGNACVESDSSDYLNKAKFSFEHVDGYKIKNVSLVALSEKLVYDLDKIKSVRITGNYLVGETLKVETNPLNSYALVKWYRGSSQNIKEATLIEDAHGESYTLTEDDFGMYIFVEVSDGYGYGFDDVTDDVMAKKEASKAITALIVIASIIGALLIAFIVWFILWKNLIVGGVFMTKAFEWVDKLLFDKKEKANTETTEQSNKEKEKKDKEQIKKEEKPKEDKEDKTNDIKNE